MTPRVQVFDGEVESLSHRRGRGGGRTGHRGPPAGVRVGRVARSGGRGRDRRRGARQRGLRAPRTSRSGSPSARTSMRRRRRRTLDLWREELLSVPAEDKVALALEVEAATRARDPRVRGVESASYGDARGGSGDRQLARRRGVAHDARGARSRRPRWPAKATAPRPGTGSRSAGRSPTSTSREAARDAAERSTRLLGARQPASRRIPVIFDPLVTQSLLGPARRRAARAKRCSRAGRCSPAARARRSRRSA